MTALGLPLASMRASGARARWQHPKAVWAADFGKRYYALGPRSSNDMETTSRAYPHLLTDASGTVQAFDVNTLAALPGVGAYIGGQVTEYFQYTDDVTKSAYWTVTGGAVAAYGTVGGRNFSVFTGDSSTGPHGFKAAVAKRPTITAGTYTGSALLMRGSRRYAEVAIVGSTGTNSAGVVVDTQNWTLLSGTEGAGWAVLSARLTYIGSGVYLIEITVTAPGDTVTFQVRGNTAYAYASNPSYTGDGVSTMIVSGLSLVNGPTARAPIITTTATATRLASDVSTVASGPDPFAGYSSAGLAGGFGFLGKINLSYIGDGSIRYIFDFHDGTNANTLRLFIGTTGKLEAVLIVGGSVVADARLNNVLTGGDVAFAGSYDQVNGLYLVQKAGLDSASAAAAGALPAFSAMTLGNNPISGNVYLNDTMKVLEITKPLTVAECNTWAAAA